ncbi:hypothetical protein RQP46_000115 [Phenoliferia psychrophenolica]
MLASQLTTFLALAFASTVACRPNAPVKWSGSRSSSSSRFDLKHVPSNSTLYLRTIGVQNGTGFAFPDCWAIQPNFTVGTDPSLKGTLDVSLGAVQTSSYVYFPEDFNAPLHGPGGNQYVIFLSGSATIHFPNVTGTIPCTAGTNLVVVDNSTVSNGHLTDWKAVRPPPHCCDTQH